MRKPNGYWTKEKCAEEILKYETIADFRKNSIEVYRIVHYYNWSDLLSGLKYKKHLKGYWSKERCKEEAVKYKTRSELKLNCNSAYLTTHNNGWIDEICSHMVINNGLSKRCIYVYEFSDNYAYIGLTYNLENRNKRHLVDTRSSVYKHIEKTSILPTIKQLTDYIDATDASILESLT